MNLLFDQNNKFQEKTLYIQEGAYKKHTNTSILYEVCKEWVGKMNQIFMYKGLTFIIKQMNPNINRHRSPTQRNQPPPLTKGYNYLGYNPLTQRADKNDMHSSTEESTKQEQSSREQQNNLKDTEYVASVNSGFYKVKKQDPTSIKNQSNSHGLKSHNSQKILSYKPERKLQCKQKMSPEKYHDYFGFKNVPQKYPRQKLKNDHKLSDSGDSQFSQNSTHSLNAQGRTLKFLTKKIEKKTLEDPHLKVEKQIHRHTPQFLQQRNEKKHLINTNSNKMQTHFIQPHRKQIPSHNLHSPTKRQDISATTLNDHGIYKRSSLTPQNKLPLNRQNCYETNFIAKNSLTPNKVSPYKAREKQINDKAKVQVQKAYKLNVLGPVQKQKKVGENSDFSFSKQTTNKNKQQQGFNSSTAKIPKNLLSLPVISVFPLSYNSIYPTSFIVLEKLAENKSSSIYKCLHPTSSVIYCLKKCAVDRNNIQQLIIQHKVSTYLVHPNLVRAFTSFYDKNNLYLLMEYMEGRSLSNKLSGGNTDKTAEERYEESMSSYLSSKSSSDVKLNRLSFKQRPKFREQFGIVNQQQNRLSNLHTYSKNLNVKAVSKAEKLIFIKSVLEQILQGLRYLHENNIIHRDLKPDNIFVSHNSYKIGDFGSCTYANSQQYIGTLDYAAPQIMLRQRYDKSIDLWSLGCIAYELDVGRPPFYHFDRNQTIRRITNIQYDEELVSDNNLMELISKLLIKSGRISANEALMQVKMLEFEIGPEIGYSTNMRQRIG